MVASEPSAPPRAQLLPRLYEEHHRDGWLSRDAIAAIAADLRLPLAEAWEVATSYPDFHTVPPPAGDPVCMGLSCVLAGATVREGQRPVGCQFRCYDAPAPGHDAPPGEPAIRLQGLLLAPPADDTPPDERLASMDPAAALDELERAGLRGRGGAYFPTARKWRAALEQRRPLALVVNAEEGEPGVFKDRVILSLRLDRFLEGLAIAQHILRPRLCTIFLNGEALAARASLEAGLTRFSARLPVQPSIVPGGGGYVLGEETTLLNALEGRKPVPRLRPPYPVESGLFGMPTVVNNVETIALLSPIFRHGAEAFVASSPTSPDAPGTKLFSVSGRVPRPGIYELPLGAALSDLIDLAGGPLVPPLKAVLCGGPSGGFLPPSELGRPLLPGPLHPTGAIAGSGSIVVLDSTSSVRQATLAMAAYNADESCGKCTPCREGLPRALDALAEGSLADLDELLEVVGVASLCGLGQMAPGPVRSALHFWPAEFQ